MFKRLGYIAETLGIGDTGLIAACQKRMSAGIGQLDPGRDYTGATTSRWGLKINTRIEL